MLFRSLEIMARHADWCVIIGLVGGGQEINRGEGGLEEWGAALAVLEAEGTDAVSWEIHVSPHVVEGTEVTAGSSLFPSGGAVNPTLTALALAIRLADHLREVDSAAGAS